MKYFKIMIDGATECCLETNREVNFDNVNDVLKKLGFNKNEEPVDNLIEVSKEEAYEWHDVTPDTHLEIDQRIIKNGTKVLVQNEWVGIVDGNDLENTEEFSNLNYYICPLEHTHEKVWSKFYKMCLRSDFYAVEQIQNFK